MLIQKQSPPGERGREGSQPKERGEMAGDGLRKVGISIRKENGKSKPNITS